VLAGVAALARLAARVWVAALVGVAARVWVAALVGVAALVPTSAGQDKGRGRGGG